MNRTVKKEDQTLSERILGDTPGSYVDRTVDRAFAHDGTGIQALVALKGFKSQKIADPEKVSIIYDHIAPANNTTTANLQHSLRDFSLREGSTFFHIGEGICPTGETWFRVPETIEISLSGELCGFASPKDAALMYIRKLGMDGATYKALEFTGEGAGRIPVYGRLTMSNMAVETGAKTGLFYSDEKTREYLKSFGKVAEIQTQCDCSYEKSVDIDLSDIVPMLAVPHRVDNAVPVTDYSGTKLDQVFLGTCTNGRYEDLLSFAKIVSKNKVQVRTIVVPASKDVLKKAVSTGIISDLIEAGCTVCPPGCGPCLGAHMGVLGEGEVGISTANRNFKNRMGVGAEYYLCSPATAAASAIKGEITSPEEIL